MKRFLLFLLLFIAAQSALADGGRLRWRQPAGSFVVTLFTSPDPLTSGQADFSVAVERPGSEGIVQDADVTIILTPAEGTAHPLVFHASHAAATSRFLEAANFSLPHAGVWRVKVVVQQGVEAGACSGQIEVLPARLATEQMFWEIAMAPVAILLFMLHQWRKRIYRIDRLALHRISQSVQFAGSTPSFGAHIESMFPPHPGNEPQETHRD